MLMHAAHGDIEYVFPASRGLVDSKSHFSHVFQSLHGASMAYSMTSEAIYNFIDSHKYTDEEVFSGIENAHLQFWISNIKLCIFELYNLSIFIDKLRYKKKKIKGSFDKIFANVVSARDCVAHWHDRSIGLSKGKPVAVRPGLPYLKADSQSIEFPDETGKFAVFDFRVTKFDAFWAAVR